MKRLDYLESLRGLAAFVVVLAHFVVGFYPALWWAKPEQLHTESGLELIISGTPLNLVYNGSFSVAIFFVLSGFVLTYGFFKNREARIALIPIFVKRYIRLLFPILFSIAAGYFLLRMFCYHNQRAAILTGSIWLDHFWKFDPSFLTAIFESFVGAFFTHQVSYNSVLWTMSYEFKGSLIVYACIILFGRYRHRDWIYAALVLFFRHQFYLAFILGMILADLMTREKDVFRNIQHKAYYVAILLTGLFIGSIPVDRPVAGTIYEGLAGIARVRTYQIMGAAMVMVSLLKSRRLQALFSKRPFLFLGRVSFSLYVLHLMVICTFSSFLFLRLVPVLSYHGAFLLSAAISIPIMFVISHYMHRYVDAKGIQASQIVYQFVTRLMRSWTAYLLRTVPSGFVRNRLFAILFDPDCCASEKPLAD